MGAVIDLIGFVLGKLRRRRLINALRYEIPTSAFDDARFRLALAELDEAQPSEVLFIGQRLAAGCLSYGRDRLRIANVAMRAFPDAAWILSLDRDGHVRAAALQCLTAPAASRGRFIAIALRLNDWVPQVRAEAVRAAKIVWPATSPDIIAEAAPYLLKQRFAWQRWDDEALCIDELLTRPDVTLAIAVMLMNGRRGALGRTLSQALRFPAYDSELLNLATRAGLPDVRALAMKTILAGRATWAVGHEWIWTDKSMGERRRVAKTESRMISVPASPKLVEAGLADRSAMVRKIVADYATEHMARLPNIAEIASRLGSDRNAAVRDRADFIARHLNTPSIQPVSER
jgi:hypothetical protein